MITNTVNGKRYIGQSINCEGRWEDHKTCNRVYALYNAIRKYGVDSFTHEILIACPIESLDFFEIAFIAGYGTFKGEGYNLTEGGSGTRGYKASDETKKKLSEAGKGRKDSDETRKKKSESALGKRKTEEHKKALSEANLGKKHTEEWKQKQSERFKGRTGAIPDQETRNKMSESAKNRPPVSDATRKKLSEAGLKRYAK
jgi:hypothetical protein